MTMLPPYQLGLIARYRRSAYAIPLAERISAWTGRARVAKRQHREEVRAARVEAEYCTLVTALPERVAEMYRNSNHRGGAR